jgi:Xaa-Pro aminopeptidase
VDLIFDQMNSQAISQLKSFLKEQKIDFFLLPNSDEFFSEYLQESEKRIEFLTGFSGSNAVVIFGQEKSYFFTDGRYTLQAASQLDESEFEIIDMAKVSVVSWINSNVSKSQKLALDPKLMSVAFVEKLKVSKVFLDENPVNGIWDQRPKANASKVFALSEKVTGRDSIAKRKDVTENLKVDALVITNPEEFCWLLNIRASDVEFNPLCLAYATLFKSGKVDLLLDEARFSDVDLKDVNFVSSEFLDLEEGIKKVQLDLAATNYWLYSEFKKRGFEIVAAVSPIQILKAKKNAVEVAGIKKTHEVDGVALTKFLFWLDESLKNGDEVDEIGASEKLLKLRAKNEDFLYPSFATIAGFGSNGAVIHYHAEEKTNKSFCVTGPRHEDGVTGGGRGASKSQHVTPEPQDDAPHPQAVTPHLLRGPVTDSLFLLDSGGQYFGDDFCGTTDVTRTILVGTPTSEMIENFTRVLKGHIALARAKFPRGTSGAQLDVLARNPLWLAGKDFAHGTGHGVGAFLAVHEGPCGISKRAHQPLVEGMILSNEPGFYENGEYGIRIENLMVVEEFNEEFLCFKTLTLAPIDPRLIDFKMMTYPERKWLREYHAEILEVTKDGLSVDEIKWLEGVCSRYLN